MKASIVNKYRFITSVIGFSLVLVLGIVFLVLFVLAPKKVPDNYVETNAKILRIEEKPSPFYDASDGIDSSDYDHRVLIEYSYGGKTYSEAEYDRYDSDMKEGDTVLLFLNPEDPEEFMGDPSRDFIFVILVVVFILIGIGGLGYTVYQKKKGA